MPKVSDSYKDTRRAEILEAAQRCFLRDGFHGTSMQNLFDESGLSSGAVYRYFPGKEALIIALAEYRMRETLDIVHTAASDIRGRSIGEMITELISLLGMRDAKDGFARLAVLIWAESVHNQKLREALSELFAQLRSELTGIVRKHQQAGTLPAEVAAEALADGVFSSLTGYVLQLAVLGPQSISGAANALHALYPQTLPVDFTPAE
ncbi:hypothetical protein GCM10009676_38990 [Prauserella halophila]|uniref:HTH tetR-type domain-containing protein n=1 Tax=Prauserella halophila TaxID=185641 RepID=A0ABN1WG74_9PSEU|nr:TetR/AcrR family transcriptional regulator [Prauserella halophila]MCP2238168.1 transcriptional regulator, TetR family [Prauserella halophila]